MTRLTSLWLFLAVIVLMLAPGAPAGAADGQYVLEFIPTYNIPAEWNPGGTMTIRVQGGRSVVHFQVRNLYPRTVYTIWTVFNRLDWKPGDPRPNANTVPACSATGGGCPGWLGWAGYPPEGSKVSPTAAIGSRFTDGISLDPGATFLTDRHGHGEVTVVLDFDVLDENPVSNKRLAVQCRPGTVVNGTCSGNNVVDITSTWLRRFIVEWPLGERARACANYDARFDPESAQYDEELANHTDARFWQCIDPETKLVRVPRYPFAHFRIANHPDRLTHGFIGGDHNDHWIDLVGPRECILPLGGSPTVQQLTPALGPTAPAGRYDPFPASLCPAPARHGGRR